MRCDHCASAISCKSFLCDGFIAIMRKPRWLRPPEPEPKPPIKTAEDVYYDEDRERPTRDRSAHSILGAVWRMLELYVLPPHIPIKASTAKVDGVEAYQEVEFNFEEHDMAYHLRGDGLQKVLPHGLRKLPSVIFVKAINNDRWMFSVVVSVSPMLQGRFVGESLKHIPGVYCSGVAGWVLDELVPLYILTDPKPETEANFVLGIGEGKALYPIRTFYEWWRDKTLEIKDALDSELRRVSEEKKAKVMKEHNEEVERVRQHNAKLWNRHLPEPSPPADYNWKPSHDDTIRFRMKAIPAFIDSITRKLEEIVVKWDTDGVKLEDHMIPSLIEKNNNLNFLQTRLESMDDEVEKLTVKIKAYSQKLLQVQEPYEVLQRARDELLSVGRSTAYYNYNYNY